MAGGYIPCGDFSGEDKSGSAITGVLATLVDCVTDGDRLQFVETVLNPIRQSIENANDFILIEPSIAARIKLPADLLYERLGDELGHPEPWDAPQCDDDLGLDPTEAKWGKGKGWQYYCVHDLRHACDRSIKLGEPICISFD